MGNYYQTVADEILGDVEVYQYTREGPNGPWYWDSLTVSRRGNTIRIRDVDGVRAETIDVAELPNGDDAAPELAEKLDEINERTLNNL